jgi:aldose 1-epimerase
MMASIQMAWIKQEPFGAMPDGTPVELFTLANSRGLRARIISYGGIVASLDVPDRHGEPANVVLGFADLAGYLADGAHFGAIVGRYANRIARGRFRLDGVAYQLECNNDGNALHGGSRGFGRVVWQGQAPSADEPRLVLRHRSPDGDQHYPGALDVTVTYQLSDDALRIDYAATTDRPTVVNLTNHSYFNLAGEASGTIYDHEIALFADAYTPVDATLIPTGTIALVDGTPFDLRKPVAVGERIRVPHEQIVIGCGFDHNFVLGMSMADEPRLAARVHDPASGRTMEVLTTEPGVQLYTGNFLDGARSGPGLGGRLYRQSDALCLETQHFPDSPNQPAFPSTVLRLGERFRSTTIYRFVL